MNFELVPLPCRYYQVVLYRLINYNNGVLLIIISIMMQQNSNAGLRGIIICQICITRQSGNVNVQENSISLLFASPQKKLKQKPQQKYHFVLRDFKYEKKSTV